MPTSVFDPHLKDLLSELDRRYSDLHPHQQLSMPRRATAAARRIIFAVGYKSRTPSATLELSDCCIRVKGRV